MTKSTRLHNRGGFTLVELMVVSFLTTLLALLLSASWSGFGRPFIEATVRAQLAQEANLAAAALAADWGGNIAGSDGRTGGVADGQLVGRLQPADAALRLCFDGGSPANGIADWGDPDTIISYEVSDGNLIRWNETAGTAFTVARYVDQWSVVDQGNGVRMTLTFSHRGTTRSYTFVGLDP